MQTFLLPPQEASIRTLEDVKGQIRDASVACSNNAELTEKLGQILSKVIAFDHFIYMRPGMRGSSEYHIWPPYKGTSVMRWQSTPEQGVILLNTYQDTIVRICGKDDFGMITMSLLKNIPAKRIPRIFPSFFFGGLLMKRSLVNMALFLSAIMPMANGMLPSCLIFWTHFCSSGTG